MPLFIPVNSSNSNQGGGGGGGLGPLSRIYAEYEHSKKKPTTAAVVKKKRSRSADGRNGNNQHHHPHAAGWGVSGAGEKKKRRSSALQDHPIWNNNMNVNMAVVAVDEKPQKQYQYSSTNEEKMTVKKEGVETPTPCSYENGCTNESGTSTVLQVKKEVASIEMNESHKKQQQQQKENASAATKQSSTTTTTQRKPCTAEGCSNQSVVNGVCFRHGAKRKLCDFDGCTNHSIRGGVCFRHGAKRKLCSVDGCTNLTQRRGVCVRHGAFIAADGKKKTGNSAVDEDDDEEGSNNEVEVGQPMLCVEIPPDLSKSSSESPSDVTTYEAEDTHVAVQRSVSASSTEALSMDATASEICVRLRSSSSSDESCPPLAYPVTKVPTKTKGGRKARTCKTEGCKNRAIQGGQCFRHGAKAHRKLCSSEGCKNYVVKAGVCIKHGARQASKKNAEEEEPKDTLKQECDTTVSEDDTDKRGRKVRSCKTEGCTNRAIQGGQCFRHGAKAHRKVCSSEGCKNYVVKAGVCIKHGARQASKKNADKEKEPKHEESTTVTNLNREHDTSANEDDLEKRKQEELFESINRLEGSCADILLLLKNDC